MGTSSSDRIILSSAIPAMTVCGACGDVVGPIGGGTDRVQTGTCRLHEAAEEERWSRYDFNRHVEICRCCGTILLRSGSKWSVWFCDDCKDAVLALGRRHGRCIVPIGRHSVHAGLMLTNEDRDDPVALHCFVESYNAITDVMRVVEDWRGVVIRRNLETMGLAPDSIVPVARYVTGVAEVDPAARFQEMVAYLQERALEEQRDKGGAA